VLKACDVCADMGQL